MATLHYRLALDLGSTSLGWAMVRLNAENNPCAVIKAGVRIFSDGRNPKDGSSLAVTRRDARAMRRRRDRLLKRKARMADTLVRYGLFPSDEVERKALVTLNPYALRAKGLDEALTGPEFARALFHINQRRGFKSNRKTDKAMDDKGAMKKAIGALQHALSFYPIGKDRRPLPFDQFDWLNWVKRELPDTQDGKPRTVGELLNRRLSDETMPPEQRKARARNNGQKGGKLVYDLYIDRAMIEVEFNALWAKQAEINPTLFTDHARDDLKDVLLYQRLLKPVKPGRCTLMPEKERAPLALPSTQRFRMYQEVNNLRVLREGLKEEPLTLKQRDDLIAALEHHNKRTFTQIKTLLGTGGAAQFNFEDPKRQELKGNTTSAILGDKKHFGEAWFAFDEAQQDAIVLQLVKEENEATLVRWLQDETGIDEDRAETIANAGLPEGYGSYCQQVLAKILPELRREVISVHHATIGAGLQPISSNGGAVPGRTFEIEKIIGETGEIKNLNVFFNLPYYGEFLQRHVGFGSGKLEDSDEKRYGKIANPTVHIGLNQVRLVVNALIKRYGHPSEVIVELARDLKQSKDHSQKDQEPYRLKLGCSCQRCVTLQQATNQERNDSYRTDIAAILGMSRERVRSTDIQKMILWDELNPKDKADRRCPYSGEQISAAALLSERVEIEHILPFSDTLDDSLNNKTVAMRQANRIKGNRTPVAARADFAAQGWTHEGLVQRAALMPKHKRYRFADDAMQQWDKDDKGFLARALNDTRHLSKVAREYVSLICPQNTRVIPGRMTAMLRAKFGLNKVLGPNGEKNRNDHRHHAVDACVIAVTDQGLLQRFAQDSASAREKQLNRLVDNMRFPWGTDEGREYFNSVKRAIDRIWVSHKPDHGHEGAMFDATIYSAVGRSKSAAKDRSVIPFEARSNQPSAALRHQGKGQAAKAYKGLLSNSNYCVEVFRTETEDWDAQVLRTFDAYQEIRKFKIVEEGIRHLRNPLFSANKNPLAMRLMINDYIRAEIDNQLVLLQVLKINSTGSITFIKPNETNISARYASKLAAQKARSRGETYDLDTLNDDFFQRALSATSLKVAKARPVTISPIGELHDPGFKE